jgi:hypothetical protein
MEKVQEKLTADQKKTYKELTGEPFDYKPEFPGGGRRPFNKDKDSKDKSTKKADV